MKKIIATVALLALCGTAQAADVIIEPVEVSPDLRAFVSAKFGVGPAFADNDITADISAFVAPGTSVSGQVENDYLIGASVEAGYFLTDNFRLSGELTYGYVENELQVVEQATVPGFVPNANLIAAGLIGSDTLDGQTFTLQGFAKAAYEVPVAENFLFLKELRLFATAGVGFVHFNNNIVLTEANNPVFLGARAEGQDTVLAGKVGFGTVSKFTDRISLTTEYNYLFGADAELELVAQNGLVAPFTLETEAHLFQTGIRISF